MEWLALLIIGITLYVNLRPKKDPQILQLEELKKAQEANIDGLKAQQETLKDKVTKEQKQVSEDGKVVFWKDYLKDKDVKKDDD